MTTQFMTRWWTEDEAIEYLRMTAKYSKRVLRYWVKQKHLKAGRRGDQYLHRQDWLDAFLEGRKLKKSHHSNV